uniref:Hypothetical conserved protein n=1 Tax=uncultured Chloroflexota bacterium TaxID=166587 RepID=H5SCX2_9CHLR|nr:hypothetical conserved protein [uncultured Chloroflexota bacterium]
MNFWQFVRSRFARRRPLSPQLHHRRGMTRANRPYRVHLRLQQDGSGILVVNASLLLYLNQTAAEFAYHWIRGASFDEAIAQMSARYRVKPQRLREDFRQFLERMEQLLETPDLDPTSDLGFERLPLHTATLQAPLRLDCALTYRLEEGEAASQAPQERVRRELTTEEWCQLLSTAWAFGIPHVVFTGGEPTLRADLPELIAHAESLGMVSGLCTSGLKLGDPAYRQDLLQSGLDHLLFLLCPEEERSWNALQAVAGEDLFTTAHLTLTPQRLPHLEATLHRLKQSGANALSLSALTPEMQPALEVAQQKAAELGLPLKFDLPVPYSEFNPVYLESEEEIPPGAGKIWLYVEPDGDVLPAQGMAGQVLGNALRDGWTRIYGRA